MTVGFAKVPGRGLEENPHAYQESFPRTTEEQFNAAGATSYRPTLLPTVVHPQEGFATLSAGQALQAATGLARTSPPTSRSPQRPSTADMLLMMRELSGDADVETDLHLRALQG